MSKRIAVFDPGVTTGVCIAELPDVIDAKLKLNPLLYELPLDDESFLNMGTIMSNLRVELILIEEFALRPDKASTQVGSIFPSSKVTGKIELIAWMLEVPIVYRKPIHMKPFESISVLERFVSGEIPKSEHMRDTLRHLLSYAFSKNK